MSPGQSDQPQASQASEAANLGIVRPPLVYLASILAGVVLHFIWPLRLVPTALEMRIGGLLVALGAVLFITAVRTFRAAGTPLRGDRPTTAVVCVGPYRFSRNPIYLSFSLIHLGLAFLINSVWLIVTFIPAVALMSFVVIPREEAFLEAHFAAEYLPYKASVRRWF